MDCEPPFRVAPAQWLVCSSVARREGGVSRRRNAHAPTVWRRSGGLLFRLNLDTGALSNFA
jgi:hypothetical protein